MREGSTVVQLCDCQEAQVVSVCGRQTHVVLGLSTKIPPFTVIRCVSNWALTQFGLWWLFRHPSAQYFLTLGFLAGRCVTGPGFCVLPPVALRFEFLDQPTHSHTAAQWRWDFHEGIAFFMSAGSSLPTVMNNSRGLLSKHLCSFGHTLHCPCVSGRGILRPCLAQPEGKEWEKAENLS